MQTTDIPDAYMARQDEREDSIYYANANRSSCLGPHAIKALKVLLYRELPKKHGLLLDLLSAERTYLPEPLQPKLVVGVGMHTEEMQANPQLHQFLVHNLNQNPNLPFRDGLFDAVLCTSAVQHLIHPVQVFREVNRVLKSKGVFVVSFSKACCTQKSVAIWLATNDAQRAGLVQQYFEYSRNWTSSRIYRKPPPSHAVRHEAPLYAVYASKLPNKHIH